MWYGLVRVCQAYKGKVSSVEAVRFDKVGCAKAYSNLRFVCYGLAPKARLGGLSKGWAYMVRTGLAFCGCLRWVTVWSGCLF